MPGLRFRCPRCRTELSDDDAEATSGVAIVRCPSCAAKVKVPSVAKVTSGADESPEAPETAPAASAGEPNGHRAAAVAASDPIGSAIDDLLPPEADGSPAAEPTPSERSQPAASKPSQSKSPPSDRPDRADRPARTADSTPRQTTPRQTTSASRATEESLFPPTIDGTPADAALLDEDGLLPPGTEGGQPRRKALPLESLPKDFLKPSDRSGAFVIPTASGEVRVLPKKKTVLVAGQERELHELSRDQRNERRTITNLVTLIFCVVVLLVGLGLLYLLTRPPAL